MYMYIYKNNNTFIQFRSSLASNLEKSRDKFKEVESDDDDEDCKPHPHQLMDSPVAKMDVDEEKMDNRKLDFLVGEFDWLTDFFRTELSNTI